MSQKPISELRHRMLEDMAARKFSEATIRASAHGNPRNGVSEHFPKRHLPYAPGGRRCRHLFS